MRARILAEMRRRRDAWEPEPSMVDLAAALGTSKQVVAHHLRILLADGLATGTGLTITPAGYEKSGG